MLKDLEMEPWKTTSGSVAGGGDADSPRSAFKSANMVELSNV